MTRNRMTDLCVLQEEAVAAVQQITPKQLLCKEDNTEDNLHVQLCTTQ